MKFLNELLEHNGFELLVAEKKNKNEEDHLFQELSAEGRYLELLKTPILKHNVPLKYIAIFLGITETSLSRIRRKIFKRVISCHMIRKLT